MSALGAHDRRFSAAVDHARTYLRSGHLPCAVVAVAGRDRILGMQGLGPGGEDDPSLCPRIFALASITKAVVGVAVARLVDQGRLDYADPVAKHFPEFGAMAWRRKIKVGDIFTHCTGLQGMEIPDLLRSDLSGDRDVLRMFKDAPAYEPGAYFQYASLTYLLLNAVVLRLLGKRMSEFLSEYVFGPCGMADTGFHPVDPARAMPLMGHPADTPEKLRRYGDLELSGSGLWSTVEDLVRMGQALLTPGRLLSRDAFERHTRSQPSLPSVAGDRSSRRTWGWNREPQAALPRQPDTGFYHGGATGTLLWLDPARDLIFVFLSTRWGSGNEHAFGTLSVLYDDAGSPLPGTPQSA